METDFHLICEVSRQFDFLLGWTLFKELSMHAQYEWNEKSHFAHFP